MLSLAHMNTWLRSYTVQLQQIALKLVSFTVTVTVVIIIVIIVTIIVLL